MPCWNECLAQVRRAGDKPVKLREFYNSGMMELYSQVMHEYLSSTSSIQYFCY